MIIEEVVVLEEAADDLEAGKVFYDQREPGVGIYFWDSLIADIESLSIFGGTHVREYGFTVYCQKDFLMQSITKSKIILLMSLPFYLYAEILHGLREISWKENNGSYFTRFCLVFSA